MKKVVETYFVEPTEELISKFPWYVLEDGTLMQPKISHGAYNDVLVFWEPVDGNLETTIAGVDFSDSLDRLGGLGVKK
jgi:hypothetical protein